MKRTQSRVAAEADASGEQQLKQMQARSAAAVENGSMQSRGEKQLCTESYPAPEYSRSLSNLSCSGAREIWSSSIDQEQPHPTLQEHVFLSALMHKGLGTRRAWQVGGNEGEVAERVKLLVWYNYMLAESLHVHPPLPLHPSMSLLSLYFTSPPPSLSFHFSSLPFPPHLSHRIEA